MRTINHRVSKLPCETVENCPSLGKAGGAVPTLAQRLKGADSIGIRTRRKVDTSSADSVGKVDGGKG
jgi:hypothetical protein